MKVRDLKLLLSEFEEDDDVCLSQPSNDYWGIVCARDVTNAEIVNVAWSSYHNANKVVDDDRLENYEKDELKKVLLLS